MIRSFFRLFRRDRDRSAPPPEERAAPHAQSGIVASASAPAFQPQNPLEEMLIAAAHDPAQRAAFHRLLLESTLFAASPDLPASRGMALPATVGQPRLFELAGPDGRRLPALFSAQTRVVEALGNGPGFFAADGAQLLALAADRGAMLNPGLGYSIHWTAADCALLLGRPVHRRREQGAHPLLGTPTEPPEALIAGLRAALAAEARITGAWLALAQWPGREGLAWYLDIRTTLAQGEVEQLLAPLFRSTGLAGRTLDLAVLPPGGEGAGISLKD